MLKKHFPHKGFSLVEVLISLIMVTSILAAMTPIISKKLLSSGVFLNVKGGGFVCKDGKYLENKKCIDCPKGFFCKENEKTPCPEGQISDTAQSECTPCEDGFYANENQDKCVKCEEGYKCSLGVKTVCPDGSYSSAGQAFCTPCPEGYYCKDGEKKSCETKFTNCNICNNSSCLSCKTGYEVENGKCVLKGFSQAFCDSLGSNLLYLTASQNGGTAACVTKANVGDTYMNGPEISSSAGVTVVKAGSYCSSDKCCWLGNNIGTTSRTCSATGNGDSTYSGCKRTVCTWAAAKAICEAWESVSGTKGKWRLPTINELRSWNSNNDGKKGLELCSFSSGYGLVQCEYGATNACYGAYHECFPYYIWSSTAYGSSNSSNIYTRCWGNNVYCPSYSSVTNAYSARCVLDEKTYFGTSSGSSGGTTSSSLPKTLTSQADCDKFGKNLLFVPAKQSGDKAFCITKANVGDTSYNGPSISSSAGVTVVSAGTSCKKGKCCWTGYTSGACRSQGTDDSDYPGCGRTVCSWAGASAACEAWEPVTDTKGLWRLPTTEEIERTTPYSIDACIPRSDFSTAYCYSGNSCKGAYGDGYCYPSDMWTSEHSGDNYYYVESDNNQFSSSGLSRLGDYMRANSARCVLDEDAVKSL